VSSDAGLHPDGDAVVVTTSTGPLRGLWHDGVARFAGIPYAAPPVGERRFRPPAPVEPWDDVRPADEFGPICPQNPSMMDALFGGDSERWDEDCLYLNVWTPDPGTDAPLPVMVWIHGGGFEMGSGSSPLYHGTRFAHDGVVLVTINYRLGSFGFLELGHLDSSYASSGNCGLLDQLAALEWVRDNIARFGGDPANVTVFGQSAGSMSISLLMASPRSDGLFHKAITQSGAANAARRPGDAQQDTAEFFAAGGWATAADVAAADPAALLAAHAAMTGARLVDPEAYIERASTPLGFLAFRPVADGELVPADPLQAIRDGAAAGVSLLAGTTSQEWRLFSLMAPSPADEDALRERVGLLVTDADAALAAYRSENPDGPVADIDGSLLTDLVFRIPTVRLADAQSAYAPTFQYLWDWKSNAFGGLVGAAHAIDIPFVFDLLEDQRLHVFVGADAPRSLGKTTNQAWISFARTGTPAADGLDPWPTLGSEATRPVMVLDTEPRLVDDPNAVTRRFWDGPGAVMPTR